MDRVVPCDEYVDEMLAMILSQIEEVVQLELTSPFDLFGVSVIEIIEEILAAPTLEIAKDILVVDDLFDGPIGLVEGVFDFVDLPLSFDVLTKFVSHSDDVHDHSFIDFSIFLVFACLL